MKTTTNLVTWQQPEWAYLLEGLFSLSTLALILIITARLFSSSSSDFLSWSMTAVPCEAIRAQAPLILVAVATSCLTTAMQRMARIIPPECVSIREPQERGNGE